MGNCAGVDWAGDKHDVRVCDAAGEELLAAPVGHDERGLRAPGRTLPRLKVEMVAREAGRRDVGGLAWGVTEARRWGWVGRAAPWGVPRAPALLRSPEAHRAAREAQARARGTRRRGRARRPSRARARTRCCDHTAGRPDQAAQPTDRYRGARAPGRCRLPVAVP